MKTNTRRTTASSSVQGFAPTTLLLSLFKKALDLSQGFWFIPTLLITLIACLAFGLIQMDSSIADKHSYVREWLGPLEPSSAKGLMQTIAGAVITITSIAFSITLVVLTMASQQFGPRLIGNFIKDKRTQIVLGVFTSTFVFCLIIIRAVKTDYGSTFVPEISVTVGMALAIFCIFTLIYFIHHVAISIQADNVIRSVSCALKNDLSNMLKLLDEHLTKGRELLSVDHFSYSQCLVSEQSGYIQAINYQAFSDLARSHNGLIQLKVRAGHHVLENVPIAHLYSDEEPPHALDISSCLLIGSARTSLQDPEFSLNQLVEMALRALSPGINDPFTAIHCVDSLGANLARLVDKDISRGLIVDDDNEVRVITRMPTFDGLLECAFDQIRQNATAHVSVILSLLTTLANLLYLSESQAVNKVALIKQVSAIEDSMAAANMTQEERQSINDALKECYAFCDESVLRESQAKEK